jgi:hypothetical protein
MLLNGPPFGTVSTSQFPSSDCLSGRGFAEFDIFAPLLIALTMYYGFRIPLRYTTARTQNRKIPTYESKCNANHEYNVSYNFIHVFPSAQMEMAISA